MLVCYFRAKVKRWKGKHNHSSSVRRCRVHCGLVCDSSMRVLQRLGVGSGLDWVVYQRIPIDKSLTGVFPSSRNCTVMVA
jgi:hypothetical protein